MAFIVDDGDALLCSSCIEIFGEKASDITKIISKAQKEGMDYILCPYCEEMVKIDKIEE